jgi:hypothetical protein
LISSAQFDIRRPDGGIRPPLLLSAFKDALPQPHRYRIASAYF